MAGRWRWRRCLAEPRRHESLQALPDRQRAAIVLTYYEDCSNLAAAEILGLNIKAFESLLLRARQALKAGLGDVRAAFAGGAA